MSAARISVSPISTASTPTRSRSSSCSRVESPDSETTVLPAGTSASSSYVRSMSTLKSGEVAVVDAEHVGLDLERGLQLALVVDLDERVEVQRGGLVQQVLQLRQLERGDDQQDRVGARRGRLVELVRVDDEVLAQHGSVRRGARRAQVVERAAEVERLGQHRQRGRAAALVGAHDVGDRSRPRGSAPADGERRLCSAITDTPGRVSASENGRKPSARRSSCASSSCRAARTCAGASTSPRVSSTMRSSTLMQTPAPGEARSAASAAAARPSSIAASAARTPASRLSARPAT